MPTRRALCRFLAAWLLLLGAGALGGAAEPQPEDREIPSDRGRFFLRDDKEYNRIVKELLDATTPLDVRVAHVGILALTGERRAVKHLVGLVTSDKEPLPLRVAVLWALAEIGDPRGIVAYQYALQKIYVKDPQWAEAKGITIQSEGGERTISLREMCEARLGRLAEPVLLKQAADQHPGLVDMLLAPLTKGITPEKPPEEDAATGRLRAALLSVAAVGDRSLTAVRALIAVLQAHDKLYPEDFKVIAVEALGSILVRRFQELKGLRAQDARLRVEDKLSDEIAVGLIQAFPVTDVPEVHEIGAEALRKAGWADRAARSLVTILKAPGLPKEVRYRSIQALAALASKEASDQLIFLLYDRDQNVRWRAAVALGTCGDKRAIPFLRELAHEEPSPDTSRMTEAQKQQARAKAKQDAFVRLKAVAALGHLQDLSTLPDLAVALGDSDFRVRRQAALALGRFGHRMAIPALVNKGLKDPHPTVRGVAIVSLGYIGRAEGLKAVPPLLAGDKSPEVRRVAAETLARFKNPGATAALVGALRDPDLVVRECAAKAVGERIPESPRELVGLLAETIAGAKGEGRLAAIACVEADYRRVWPAKGAPRQHRSVYERLLGTPAAPLAAALIAALKDDVAAVRAAAAALLADHGWSIKSKDLLAPVAALADDPAPNVRTVAGKAKNFLNNMP